MTDQKKQTVLYIDGQNFTTRIRSILRRSGVEEVDLAKFDFWGLLSKLFAKEQVDLVQIYFAKLHAHKDTAEKSEELIKREEELKAILEQQGIKYITAGSVRPRKRGDEIEFVEKGVDIRIAVDMVKDVIDGTVGKVLLASSDSDMQPAIYEIKRRGAEVYYVGFASRMNRGMMLTTDRYVLIDTKDVVKFYDAAKASAISSKASEVDRSPQVRHVMADKRTSSKRAQLKQQTVAVSKPVQDSAQPAPIAESKEEPVIQLHNQRLTYFDTDRPAPKTAAPAEASTAPKPPIQKSETTPAPDATADPTFNRPPWTRRDI